MENDGISAEVNAQYLDLWAQMPYPLGPAFLGLGVNVGLGLPLGDTGAQVGVLYVLGLAEPVDGVKWNGLFFNAGYSF